MTTASVKKARVKIKARIGYVSSTPRCDCCDHYEKGETVSVPPNRKAYVPPVCTLHSFPAKPVGLCDSWEREGETLEAASA